MCAGSPAPCQPFRASHWCPCCPPDLLPPSWWCPAPASPSPVVGTAGGAGGTPLSCAPHPTRGRIQLSGHTEGLGSHPLEGRGAAPAPPSLLLGQDVTTSSSFPVAPRGCDGADPTGGGDSGTPESPAAGGGGRGYFCPSLFPGPSAASRAAARRASRLGGFFATSSARARCGCCCVKSRARKMRKRGAGAGAGQGGEEHRGAARGQLQRLETPPCPPPPPAQVTRVPLPPCPRVALLGTPRGVVLGCPGGVRGSRVPFLPLGTQSWGETEPRGGSRRRWVPLEEISAWAEHRHRRVSWPGQGAALHPGGCCVPKTAVGASPEPGWGAWGCPRSLPLHPPPPLPAFEKQKPGRKARRALAARSKKRSYFHFFLPRFLFSALVLLNEAAQDLGGGVWRGGTVTSPPSPAPQGRGRLKLPIDFSICDAHERLAGGGRGASRCAGDGVGDSAPMPRNPGAVPPPLLLPGWRWCTRWVLLGG